MANKIFFDTNILRNPESTEHFLGGRDQLSRFEKVAEILIPTIVNSEIKNQKRRHLVGKRDSFKNNPFFQALKLKESSITDNHINDWLNKIEADEKIEYTKVSLKNRDVLSRLVDMAIENHAPFETTSDKGFKDAMIYFTVIQYAEENPSDQIYFISRDLRLQEAFKKHPEIIVFADYEEYQKHQSGYFTDNYFIERLQQEINERYGESVGKLVIDPSCVKDIKLTKELIWELGVEIGDKEYWVKVDYSTKEIIDIIDISF